MKRPIIHPRNALLIALALASTTPTSAASSLVPIAPCRLVDTRQEVMVAPPYGWPSFQNGEIRTLRVSGQGLAQADCENRIPSGSSAIVVNFTALRATTDGFVSAGPGEADPSTAFLYFTPGQVATNGTTLPVLDDSVSIRLDGGPADLIIDVLGYYVDESHHNNTHEPTGNTSTFHPDATCTPAVCSISIGPGLTGATSIPIGGTSAGPTISLQTPVAVASGGTGLIAPGAVSNLLTSTGTSSYATLPAVLNVMAFGALGNGLHDDAPNIQNAIAALPCAGGTVYFPPGTYNIGSSLLIGNGTPLKVSDCHGVRLVGSGGSAESSLSPLSGTTLSWVGGTSTNIIEIDGPISGVAITDLEINCNAAANVVAIYAIHPYQAEFRNLRILNNAGTASPATYSFGIVLTTNTTQSPSSARSSSFNTLTNVSVTSPYDYASGINLGASINTAPFDTNQTVLVGCKFRFDAAPHSIGIRLQYTDENTFLHCLVAAPIGVQAVVPSQQPAPYPQAIWFYNCNIAGQNGAVLVGTWLDHYPPIVFWPYVINEGQAIPQANIFTGITNDGLTFGALFRNRGTNYEAVTSSAPLTSTTETAFNKSYTLPIGKTTSAPLNTIGATIRVRAAGVYSVTPGTAPSMTLRIKVGGQVIGEALLGTNGSANNFGWSAQATGIIRAVGTSGAIQPGFGLFGMAGVAAVASDLGPIAYALDTTSSQPVTVTAAWGTTPNSPGKTITLNSLEVDVLTPFDHD